MWKELHTHQRVILRWGGNKVACEGMGLFLCLLLDIVEDTAMYGVPHRL
jgi:hypothetical protein